MSYEPGTCSECGHRPDAKYMRLFLLADRPVCGDCYEKVAKASTVPGETGRVWGPSGPASPRRVP